MQPTEQLYGLEIHSVHVTGMLFAHVCVSILHSVQAITPLLRLINWGIQVGGA